MSWKVNFTRFLDYMKKKKIIFLLVIICLFIFSQGIYVSADDSYGEIKEKLDSIVKGRYKVGLIVGITWRGKRYTFPYGIKSLEDEVPPDGDTVFEIGSITKTFTAVILAQMYLDGEISLNDPASKYLPSDKVMLPEAERKVITIKHLAVHTSGIPSMPSNAGEFREIENPFKDYSIEKFYQFLSSCKLEFPPGTRHKYSNSGYGLLGHILARASGKSYERILHEKVFDPLEMKNSSLVLASEQMKNLAAGYDLKKNRKSNWTAREVLQGSGFIKSTLNDMFNYLEAAMGLKSTCLDRAFKLATSPVQEGYPGSEICLGWYIERIKNGIKVISHSGSTGGYYAFIGFDLSRTTGVIVLCNNMFDKSTDAIGFEILSSLCRD